LSGVHLFLKTDFYWQFLNLTRDRQSFSSHIKKFGEIQYVTPKKIKDGCVLSIGQSIHNNNWTWSKRNMVHFTPWFFNGKKGEENITKPHFLFVASGLWTHPNWIRIKLYAKDCLENPWISWNNINLMRNDEIMKVSLL